MQKGHFPYEYMDGIGKLEDCALPPQEAFYSRLKNEHITDADYARCQVAWRDNRMKTMRDFLMWYNNRDAVPFLDAIDEICLLQTAEHRYVQRWRKRPGTDIALSLQ